MPNTDSSIQDIGIPEITMTVEPASIIKAPVDDTLSIKGMAADAMAVGQALLQNDLTNAKIDEIVRTAFGEEG